MVGYLKAMENDAEVAAAAFRSVFSRESDEEEKQAIVSYLSERSDRREDAIKQVVWAMMSSPEFRFNH